MWTKGVMGREHWNGWTVRRAPSFRVENGQVTRLYWLYRNGSRYTPTGRYDDAVSFPSAPAARAYAIAHTVVRCARCGSEHTADRSCGCFDNHCQ
jgi:hypothetical protein